MKDSSLLVGKETSHRFVLLLSFLRMNSRNLFISCRFEIKNVSNCLYLKQYFDLFFFQVAALYMAPASLSALYRASGSLMAVVLKPRFLFSL